MRTRSRIRKALVGVTAAAALALVGCSAPGGPAAEGGKGEVVVGALTSLSGANSPSGKNWLQGFKVGLDYATGGTGEVNGTKITVEEVDDRTDPNTAMTEATDLVGRGVKIIAGTQSSGIALNLAGFAEENDILYITGSANSNQITGANDNTFRGSRQAYQDVATLVEGLGDEVDGAKIGILAHDIEYGKSLIETTKEIVGSRAASITEVLAPFPTDDVAPYVQRIKSGDYDIVIPFWSGDVTAMWRALEQQDIFSSAQVMSNIGMRPTWPTYAEIKSPNLSLFTSYVEKQVDNDAARFLDKEVAGLGNEVDYIHADGFLAAQMVVHAVGETNAGSTADMIAALEGYFFDSPRGPTSIRAEDHALTAPMVFLHFEDGKAVVDSTVDGADIAPPLP